MSNDNLLVFNNIKKYKYKFSTTNIIITKDDNNYDNNDEKSYYYILDSYSLEKEYFIFESFIFIDLFIKLNKTNKKIKILTRPERKTYIKILLDFFKIENEVIYEIDNFNNICYSPKIYSIYYLHRLNQDEYYNYHLNLFIDYIKNNLNIMDKSNLSLLLKDYNYTDNDKLLNISEKCNILNNKNIINDFSILNNTEKIIINYAPHFYINCIFLENKDIILISNNIYDINNFYTHIYGNPFLKYLYELINRKNKIYVIKSEQL